MLFVKIYNNYIIIIVLIKFYKKNYIMDTYYRKKIDELFKKDLQTHENIKEKSKIRKEEQLEVLSQLKKTYEEKSKKKFKINLNTRKSINVLTNQNNRFLLNKVTQSNVNNGLFKKITKDIVKMNSNNKIPLIKKSNILRVCNTVKDYGDLKKKNFESKKPPPLNINVVKFVDHNELNNIELELSNISFYDKFLKNIKEEKEKTNQKLNQENDKDDKETNNNTNEFDVKNNIPGKTKINNSIFDISKNNNTNDNKEIKNDIKDIKEFKGNSPLNLKLKHKMRKHSTKIESFGDLQTSCNLDYLIKSKKEFHKKKNKNHKKSLQGGIHKEKSKRKQEENINFYKLRKLQNLSQTPLNIINRNKIISDDYSIQDYCCYNNNKFKIRYKEKLNRNSNGSIINNSEGYSPSSFMKSNKNNSKKQDFIKYYSSGEEDEENGQIKNKNESSFEDNIIRDPYDQFEKVESVGKHRYRNSSLINDKYHRFNNKRNIFNTQNIMNNNKISMEYDLDLISKKSKATKNNFLINSEQYLDINNNKLQIMKAENLISLEFNGKKYSKDKNLTENKKNNSVNKSENNVNFYNLNINDNYDEKNDTDNGQKQKKEKKIQKKRCFCCL